MQTAFKNIENLYSPDGYKALKGSSVTVIGLGGVGSWSVETLVRSGIGTINLVDLDDICVSNINRQIQAHTESIGQAKVVELKKRCELINPEVQINIIEDFYTKSSSQVIFDLKADFIIDAIDSVMSKAHLLSECRKRSIKVITTGAAGGKVDPTQIKLVDLNRSYNDKLLLQVRRDLKKYYGFPKYEKKLFHIPCLFSPEELIYPEGTCETEKKNLSCTQGLGSSMAVTATFGIFAANFVINSMANES